MRFSNTAGPINCQKHYCVPPLTRFSLDDILGMIDRERYFVLHAPRQEHYRNTSIIVWGM